MKNENILTDIKSKSLKEARAEIDAILRKLESQETDLNESINDYERLIELNKHIENMALNKVNIEFLRKQMDKVLEDIESLKDDARDMHYKNGNGQ